MVTVCCRWISGRWRSKFIRNILILVSGTALGQVITLAVAPILSRLYTPSDFGDFGVFMSIVGTISAVATLRFDQALMLPKEAREAASLMSLALVSVIICALGCSAIFFVSGRQIASLVNSPDLAKWLWMAPLSVIAVGGSQTFAAWAARNRRFVRTSSSQLLRSIVQGVVQIVAGIACVGSPGLLFGALMADSCACGYLGTDMFRSDRKTIRRHVSVGSVRRVAEKYTDFPMYSSPQSLLNAVSQNIPLFLLAYYFDARTVGLYSIGVRVVQLPMNLVLVSVRQVLFQRMSEVNANGGDVFRLFKSATLGLAAVAVIPVAVCVLFGPKIFAVALGAEWGVAGEYARWLVIWLAGAFMNVPSMLMGQIRRAQRWLLAFDVALLAVRVLALVVGGLNCSALQTIILFSIVGAVFNVGIIVGMWAYARPVAYLE